MGRRKIRMEKVQDTNTKQVTFSKRRLGLFKKASELSTLCNAEVGIVVFSPGNKPYSFGKPSFDSIAERFKNESEESSDSSETSTNGGRGGPRVRGRQEKRICKRLNSIMSQVEAEKKRGEELQNQLETAGEEKFNKPVEELSLEELKEYEGEMMNMHRGIQSNIKRMQVSAYLILLKNDRRQFDSE